MVEYENIESGLLKGLDETIDPAILKIISSHATQSEKTSWRRKQDRLQELIDQRINPLSEEISILQQMLDVALIEAREAREEMVSTCIHPHDMLVVSDGAVECKFCNKRMMVVNHGSK